MCCLVCSPSLFTVRWSDLKISVTQSGNREEDESKPARKDKPLICLTDLKCRSRGRGGRGASCTIRTSDDNRSCWIRRSPRWGGLRRGRRSGVVEMQVLWDQQSVDFLTRTPRVVAPLPDGYSHRNDLCAKREPSKESYNGHVGHQPSTRHHGREFVITHGTSNFSSSRGSRGHRSWLKYFHIDSSYTHTHTHTHIHTHTCSNRSKMKYVTGESDCVPRLNTPSGPNSDGTGYLIYYSRTASTAGSFQNCFYKSMVTKLYSGAGSFYLLALLLRLSLVFPSFSGA